jgi:hypothetical protein
MISTSVFEFLPNWVMPTPAMWTGIICPIGLLKQSVACPAHARDAVLSIPVEVSRHPSRFVGPGKDQRTACTGRAKSSSLENPL